ncbi:unnamed protein product [Brassica oleracea var. botrytis]|uniref:TF-B3 domain-containing protein n=3 Tax=Brassica TaxID=3705 RepID=A0A0D3DCU4_BRAOL|nr:hypothetical protein HID58_077283 [Brassica napus]CAF2014658.1 unnamed protein product [Brassica napus]VDD39208.1 unnamed protein product [Brassica oleracea]
MRSGTGDAFSRRRWPLATMSSAVFISLLISRFISPSGARQADAHVNNPEQYLSNPSNPFFVKTLGKKIVVLYVSHLVTEKYGLQFGPHNSPMLYLLPNEKIEANTKIYGGCACFNGWAVICRKYKLKQGDAVVCELERSGGVVTVVRLHFPNE